MTHSLLDLAKQTWKLFLKPGDFAIDATCGNGHDSLALASLLLSKSEGSLLCMDIQKRALKATKEHLQSKLSPSQIKKITYYLGCHSSLPSLIRAPKGIIYNLGYLPGSDKQVKTAAETTLESVRAGLKLISPGGGMSITIYSGHKEGEEEKKSLLNFSKSLKKNEYQVFHLEMLNREHAPSLLTILKNSLPIVS